MGYTAEMERDFIKEDLGPMLSLRGHADVKIIMLDDSRLFLPSWVDTILSDPVAAKYVAGIGVHWYEDKYMPAKVLTDAHNRWLLIIYTILLHQHTLTETRAQANHLPTE